jgi:hypothetical protein
MDKKKKNNDKLITLFLLFTAYQFLLHLFFGFKANDPRLILPTLIAFFHDIAILGIVTIIGKTVSYFVLSKFKNSVNQVFYILLIVCGVLLSFYPKMLREYHKRLVEYKKLDLHYF